MNGNPWAGLPAIQPIRTRSPLEAYQQAVSIRDMRDQKAIRAQEMAINEQRLESGRVGLESTQLELGEQKRAQTERNLYSTVMQKHAKRDESGGIQFNDAAIRQELGPYPNLLNLYEQQKLVVRETASKFRTLHQEEVTEAGRLAKTTLKTITDLPEPLRPSAYLRLKSKLTGMKIPDQWGLDAEQALKDAVTEAESYLKPKEPEKRAKLDVFTNKEGKRVIAMQEPDGKITYEEGPEEKPDKNATPFQIQIYELWKGQQDGKKDSYEEYLKAEETIKKEIAAKFEKITKTDQDKLTEYYLTNRPLADYLSKQGEKGPSIPQKLTMTDTARFSGEVDANGSKALNDEATYEQIRKFYLPLWPDMPSFSQVAPPKPSTSLPVPKNKGETATTEVLRAYQKAYPDDDDAAALKALKDAGWQ